MDKNVGTASARVGRRRSVQRKTPDNTVASPCIGICMLGNDGLCQGCLRNIDEIREWMIMDRDEKLAVLENVELRQKQRIND